jgi:outer membrane protein OmpA-like peptidoglycan-associated protein
VAERSKDIAALDQRLLNYRQGLQNNLPGAPRRLVEQLWLELRQQDPQNYAFLLRSKKLIQWWPYWRWFQKGQARLVTAVMAVLGLLLGALLVEEWLEIGQENPGLLIAYNLWRFDRTGTSDRDRDRSRMFLEDQLKERQSGKGELVSPYEDDILNPLIARLRYKATTADQARDVLDFVRATHSPVVDQASLPALIKCERTESFELRTKIQELLLDMAEHDWTAYPASEDLKKMPEEKETTRVIEARVQKWLQWWASTKAPPATKNPVESGLMNEGKVDLPGLFFDTGKPTIRPGPESEIALKQVVDALSAHADWKLRVEGHTDNVGGKDFNLHLSQKRAESVVAALEQRGVAAGRLQAEGFGFSKPEAPNDAEDGRARNRRARLVKL